MRPIGHKILLKKPNEKKPAMNQKKPYSKTNKYAIPLLRDIRFWRIAGQALMIIVVLITLGILWDNLTYNLERLNLDFGFDFLGQQAAFDIGERPLSYERTDAYGRAMFIGILNSLRVILIGIILATLLGVTIGIARLSDNWLVRRLAIFYVETIRNTPLLLQLFFWYFAIFLAFPPPDKAINLLGILGFSNKGLDIATLHLSSEFSALLFGLTTYTAAFIAEIVRAGLQAVPKGQWEAAKALGLKPDLAMRLVIFPQALRVIIPPLTSEYLNLAKNSSLAIAVAYPDVYSVYSTTLNQTGRSVEVILLLMFTYLTFNLIISLVMNWFNKTVQIKER